jgi:hypothetical protein
MAPTYYNYMCIEIVIGLDRSEYGDSKPIIIIWVIGILGLGFREI